MKACTAFLDHTENTVAALIERRNVSESQLKEQRFPNPLVLIFGMIVVAQIATYVLPAGKYDRDAENKNAVIPGTYQRLSVAAKNSPPANPAAENGNDEGTADKVDANQVTRLPWHAFLSSIPKGLNAGGDIIFFVFIVGGVIGVIRATGAIDAVIGESIQKFGTRPILLVSGMVTLFAVGSATIGMAEEYMPFIPILVTMCLAMKMDAMVAMGIVYIGAGIGYGCAMLNPFTVVIAQKIAGLDVYSGWELRAFMLIVCLAIGIHHLLRYAKKIQTDPELSLVRDVDYSDGYELPKDTELTISRILIVVGCIAGLSIFVWGVTVSEWYLTELTTIFLLVAIVSAMLGRLGPNQVAKHFCEGAAELTTTALLIGFARTIEIVLQEGNVIDTVIHGIAQPLQTTGPQVTAVGMLFVQSVCNFFIPSGSGQAYVTMPIMAPLADLTNVSRQTAVLAYQLGDGLTNMIVPTNALLMGMLVLGRIPFQRWLRFIIPLMVKLYAAAIVFLLISLNM